MKVTNPYDRAGRRYLIELFSAMALYVVVLVPCTHALASGVGGAARVALALAPVVPVALVFVAVVRYLNAIDELQRRIHVESLAIAAGATALLAITYAFLESAGLPHLSAWWTWVAIAICFVVAKPFVVRRYQ